MKRLGSKSPIVPGTEHKIVGLVPFLSKYLLKNVLFVAEFIVATVKVQAGEGVTAHPTDSCK